MKPNESTRFYNWLGAMAALLAAVVLTWVWRFSTPPAPQFEMQAEEAVGPSSTTGLNESVIGENEELTDSVVAQRLNANVNLDELYTAQKIYRGENGHYTTDLVATGWKPAQALMSYKLSFLEPSVPMDVDEIPTRTGTDDFLTINEALTDAPYVYSPDAQMIDLSRYAALCRTGCTADAQSFEVMIAVPLDNQGRADIWLLNERKELVHVWDGLSNQALQ